MTTNETDSYFGKRGELAQFASSLKEAISDREKKHEVRFYYDAQVVVWLVLGFDFEPTGSTSRDRLVHALLATGYLGRVHILRPHALEFYNVLQGRSEFRSPRSVAKFRDRVLAHVRRRGVDLRIKEIADAIRGKPQEEQLDILLEKFRSSGAEIFATIALTHGFWQERLKRLHDPDYKILRFDDTKTDMRDAIAQEDVWTFYRVIAGARKVEKSVNTLADATALSLLSHTIKQRVADRNQDIPDVRFYTATESIRAVLNDPECAQLLQYSNPAGEPESVFRSTNYYILRASFDALRFGDLRLRQRRDAKEDEFYAITLTELRDVANQVTKALEATAVPADAALEAVTLSKDQLTKRIESIRVGQSDLSTVLEELEKNAFLKRVLTHYEPPDAFRAILTGFGQVWDAFDTKTASARLHDEIRREAHQLTGSLRNVVEELKQSFEFTRRVLDHVGEMVQDGKYTSVPDPMRDLGLVRWAAHLNEHSRSVLSGLIQSLFVEGASPDSITRACSNLVSLAESPEDESMCCAIAGLLWTLNLFGDIVEVINRYHDYVGTPSFPVGLNIMRTAARLRSNNAFSRDEKETHVNALEGMVKNAPERCRGRLYIGLGYVAFYLWYNDQPLVGSSPEDPEWANRWAAKSLDHGKQAVSLLSRDPLGMAFAVNHCAFTTMTTHVGEGEAKDYLTTLTNFRANPPVWNYRFADTIATEHLSRARTAWATSRDLKPQLHERAVNEAKACSALIAAETILQESKPYFGDAEVHKTLLQVRLLLDEIGCPRPGFRAAFSAQRSHR